ncbi:MAG: ATP-binding protein [Candidatus Poribacteria bacterium]|nr:ATP-binding protein [Candidatus Poribacteria bacterium]
MHSEDVTKEELQKKLAEAEQRIAELEASAVDANNQLKQKHEELIGFIENASVPLHRVDENGMIVWANPVESDSRGYTRDITKRKQKEDALRVANKDLNDFAYIASHDLKAPLRAISSLADWLKTDYGDKLDDPGKEILDMLGGRINRMYNLIDGILQYSRAGRVREEAVKINLNELVVRVLDTVAPPENFEVTIPDELPTIWGEPTCVEQIFQNLVENAIKYMDKPDGRIEIGCVRANGCWRFRVADNGPGIEERHFERIFQMFQTLAPRDEIESTGVGLAVVKKSVEMCGGKTWVESEVSQGSTFFFTLPQEAELSS